MYRFDSLQTCQMNDELMRNASRVEVGMAHIDWPVLAPLGYYQDPEIYIYGGSPSAYLGPESTWRGSVQDEIYVDHIASLFHDYSTGGSSYSQNRTWQASQALKTRVFLNDTNSFITLITNASGSGYQGFGIYSPTPETATLFYSSYSTAYSMAKSMAAFSVITDRISNATSAPGSARSTSATLRVMRHAENKTNFLGVPITILLVLCFIAASSIAVIYPAYEKNNRVRALQYCNGVSPFALWTGYFLFDLQFILIQSIFVWGLLFAGPLARLWYQSTYILGALILFGMATYLGTYVISLFLKKAAFAVAAGIHVLLFVLYFVAYVMIQSFGDKHALFDTYNSIQFGLGLTSPGANLARAMFIASNGFEILCGKYATADVSNPFSYDRYGSVYVNLLLQIVFLAAFLMIYEYGSADWFRRNITHRGIPSRLHYIVEADPSPTVPREPEKNVTAASATASSQILNVSRISKFFGKNFAVENVSFNISANQTLALLGGNGAGKTTVINMIRGELKPNFGDIFLDGISVLRNTHKARLQMGVCPQDDAVDNLTVRQTLTFYATVKGLKNISGNVDKVLEALNITIYEDIPVKALSGGTKRKLSVAIALLGNPASP
jgi:ATP-binding cassette subfamily A (ABC1) protein 3